MTIRLQRVSKSYSGRAALVDVSLTFNGRVAVLGANGSGKTTLLRLLATLIRSDSGRITWRGIDYAAQLQDLRRRIGYLPQIVELPGDLTPRRLLHYLSQLRRVDDRARPGALLSALRLNSAADAPISTLSGGQLRLLCIAQALLARPEILLLDEVFSGLGIEERQRVTRLLTVENVARLTVFSAHTIADAGRLAQQAVMLDAGRVTFFGSIDDLRRDGAGT